MLRLWRKTPPNSHYSAVENGKNARFGGLLAANQRIITREMKMNTAQNTAKSADDLKAALICLGLSQAQFALVINTPSRTVAGWCAGETKPPPMFWRLLAVIEGSGQARRILGVHKAGRSGEPRGRPFRRGNEFRFNDKRRRDALAEAAGQAADAGRTAA